MEIKIWIYNVAYTENNTIIVETFVNEKSRAEARFWDLIEKVTVRDRRYFTDSIEEAMIYTEHIENPVFLGVLPAAVPLDVDIKVKQ